MSRTFKNRGDAQQFVDNQVKQCDNLLVRKTASCTSSWIKRFKKFANAKRTLASGAETKSGAITTTYMNPSRFPLCEVSRGTLQHAQKRLAQYDIVFSYAGGVKKWAEGLVEPAHDVDGDVWERCGDVRLLTRHEQIQQIDYLTRWKTLLVFLAEHDAALRGDATMAPAYAKIAEVLGYDPRLTDRRAE